MTTPLKQYDVSITVSVVAHDAEDAEIQGLALIRGECDSDQPCTVVDFTGYSEFDEEGHVLPLVNRRHSPTS